MAEFINCTYCEGPKDARIAELELKLAASESALEYAVETKANLRARLDAVKAWSLTWNPGGGIPSELVDILRDDWKPGGGDE